MVFITLFLSVLFLLILGTQDVEGCPPVPVPPLRNRAGIGMGMTENGLAMNDYGLGMTPSRGMPPFRGMTPFRGMPPIRGMSPFRGMAPFRGMGPINGMTPFKGMAPLRRRTGSNSAIGYCHARLHL